jgi:hypothetical protein
MHTNIAQVISRMHVIANAEDSRDGVRSFNFVYQRLTKEIRDRLATGFFEDDAFVEYFVMIFAKRYFAAVDADSEGQRVDAAWRPLFDHRFDRRVFDLQFALAGMNAHVNHDLPLALIAACDAQGTSPQAASVESDFVKVNILIEEVESATRRSLLVDLQNELRPVPDPLLHLIGTWSVIAARHAGWGRAQVLWFMRNNASMFQTIAAISSKETGMVSRQLLTPLATTTNADDIHLGRKGSIHNEVDVDRRSPTWYRSSLAEFLDKLKNRGKLILNRKPRPIT